MTSGEPPPEVVYIIRHGEKPPDPPAAPATSQVPTGPPYGVDAQGNQDDHSVIPRGWQRSGALAVLFDPALAPLQAGLRCPDALFSPSYGDPSETSEHRTYQTIQELGDRLGLQIASPFAEGEEAALAGSIVASSSGVVLICWEHDHIPALAGAFPLVTGTTIPPSWPGDRFDVIWTFTLAVGATPTQYAFGQVPQQLLAGDSDTVISAS